MTDLHDKEKGKNCCKECFEPQKACTHRGCECHKPSQKKGKMGKMGKMGKLFCGHESDNCTCEGMAVYNKGEKMYCGDCNKKKEPLSTIDKAFKVWITEHDKEVLEQQKAGCNCQEFWIANGFSKDVKTVVNGVCQFCGAKQNPKSSESIEERLSALENKVNQLWDNRK